MTSSKRDQVFICYARKDQGRCKELQTHLKPLIEHPQMKVWSDHEIEPGSQWREEIAAAITKAKVAILLVSPEFLASDFISRKELPPILEAAGKTELKILWVLLSDCNYDHTPIQNYQATHDPKRPLDVLSKGRRNQVWRKICNQIAKEMLETNPTKRKKPKTVVDAKATPPASETPRMKTPPNPALGDRQEISLPNGASITMLWVPPGTFMMGSPEGEEERFTNETQHEVSLNRGFWMGQTGVSQSQWSSVMAGNPSHFKGQHLPVECVSWHDCQEFIRKLNEMTLGKRYRLPSEAEWEYACRAGTTTPFALGKTITSDQVNFNGLFPYGGNERSGFRERTVAVIALSGNQWGFKQMHGNVYEWCQDYYGDYAAKPQVDPVGQAGGQRRVLRGGSWDDHGKVCRSAVRYGLQPDVHSLYVGFRLVRDH